MQQKLKKGIGNMKGSMWQCGNHKRQKEQRFKSGGEQGTDRFSASVHTADCDRSLFPTSSYLHSSSCIEAQKILTVSQTISVATMPLTE